MGDVLGVGGSGRSHADVGHVVNPRRGWPACSSSPSRRLGASRWPRRASTTRCRPERSRPGTCAGSSGGPGSLQIDSVNVFARAHHMPAFSRIGPVADVGARHAGLQEARAVRVLGARGVVPADRPAPAVPLEDGARVQCRQRLGSRLRREAGPDEAAAQAARDRGPVRCRCAARGTAQQGPWWDWDDVKVGLEYLFVTGQVSVARRTAGFERLYDLTERVIPKVVLDLPDVPMRRCPARADPHRRDRARRRDGEGPVRLLPAAAARHQSRCCTSWSTRASCNR